MKMKAIKYYIKWYWKYFKFNFNYREWHLGPFVLIMDFQMGMPGAVVPTWTDWFGNQWPIRYKTYKILIENWGKNEKSRSLA